MVLPPFRLWVDTGHMNSDSGAVSGSIHEVRRNDDVADQVEILAAKQGWAVGYTNEADAHTTLSERVADAHRFGANIVVSIHHDWIGGRQAVIYPNNHHLPESRRLAELISMRIDPFAPTISIVYADKRNLTVLRTTKIPAVIVEVARVQDPYKVHEMAEAIVRGICDYLKVPFKEVAPTLPEKTYRIVTVETNSPVHRAALIDMYYNVNAANAVLGRAMVFFDELADVKKVEAYVAKFPAEIKRTNGVRVEAGQHRPLNTALPHGSFSDEEAFGGADGLEAEVKRLQEALGVAQGKLRAIQEIVEP